MVNFERNIYCVLGLPFDAVSMTDTLESIRYAAQEKEPCFISTPNLNFLISSQNDKVFRNSVINSDLSIADGMPIVWIARLLKLPITERVSGAGLFEKLRESEQAPLKVFFFGGAEGVAEKAYQRLNDERQGVIAVGHETPGFGSIEEMSSEQTIARINASNADFLVVALGAKKGQAWIERNREKLNTPIISHLGAVVNFVAGNIQRAPVYFQMLGLEWLWRIYQEPALWKRYYHDGISFCRLLATKVLPYAIWIRAHQKELNDHRPVRVDKVEMDSRIILRLTGGCVSGTIAPLKQVVRDVMKNHINLELDMGNVSVIDSAFIGFSMLLAGDAVSRGGKLVLSNVNVTNRKILGWNCAEFLLKN